MTATATSKAKPTSAKAFTPRKATFDVTEDHGKKVFVPVNKRAKTVARKLGKRTRVTVADLKRAKTMGSYRLCDASTLKALKV